MNTRTDLDFASCLQAGKNGCGASALLMLLDAYGMPSVSRKELLEVAGADEAGVSLLGLKTAAGHCGFVARTAECSAARLDNLPVPFVALMNAGPCAAGRCLRRALTACCGEAVLLAGWTLLTVLLTVAGFLTLRCAVMSLPRRNELAFACAAGGMLLAAAARTAMHAGQQRLLRRVQRKVGRLARDRFAASLRSPCQFTLNRQQTKTVVSVMMAIKQSARTAAALLACACDGVQIVFLVIAVSLLSPHLDPAWYEDYPELLEEIVEIIILTGDIPDGWEIDAFMYNLANDGVLDIFLDLPTSSRWAIIVQGN